MPSLIDFTDETTMRAMADARGWDAGLALADAGTVTFESITPERAVATVNAPDGPARVELTAGDRFGYTCSCTDVPEACRHIVATALAIPRHGPLDSI
jgi:uncharacterized Zn finger protein